MDQEYKNILFDYALSEEHLPVCMEDWWKELGYPTKEFYSDMLTRKYCFGSDYSWTTLPSGFYYHNVSIKCFKHFLIDAPYTEKGEKILKNLIEIEDLLKYNKFFI